MTIEMHQLNDLRIAEVVSADRIINTPEDGTDLLGNLYYQGYDAVILHQQHVTPDFFELKTGLAGEVLQKFSTYRVRLAIVDDFTGCASKSLNDFIRESNKGRTINFVGSTAEALTRLSIHAA